MQQVTNRKQKETKYTYTLICDMNNIMKIASVNKDVNSDGLGYGIILTSLKIIGGVLLKKDFDYCIAAYDGLGSGVLRWKMHEDYKGNRDKKYALYDPEVSEYMRSKLLFERMVLEKSKSKGKESTVESDEEAFSRQKEILQNILEEIGVRQYEYDNIEGDDIIAYYVKNKKDNEKVVIISSDKDLTQLISETVIVYNPRIKEFITNTNSVEKIGITHENVVLEKILCGDVSDNIKGVKGLGTQTLLKMFPKIKTDKMTIEEVIEMAKVTQNERKQNKKKPLKVLDNIILGVTDGCQGDRLYEVNRAIVDLSEPLMTEEAINVLKEEMYTPIDMSNRSVKNIYSLASDLNLGEMLDEDKFGNVLSPFSRIHMMEKRRYDNYLKNVK